MNGSLQTLAIFCIFDKDGIIDRYIEYWLDEISRVADRIIIVVNGILQDSYRSKLLKYTKEIYIRKNAGYDAGAYRYIICNILGLVELRKYDRLILCNDTCYGPFIPLSRILEQQGEKDILSFKEQRRGYVSFIDTFFLSFGKKIIYNDIFYDFWLNEINEEATQIEYVYAKFEIYLYRLIRENNWTYFIVSSTDNYNIYSASGECIKSGLPLIKKKAFSPKWLDLHNLRSSIIEAKKYNYDISMIQENANRLYDFNLKKFWKSAQNNLQRENAISIVKSGGIEHFIANNGNIYLYGTGIVAARIYTAYFYKKNDNRILGFVVSEKRSDEHYMNRPILIYQNLIAKERDKNKFAIIVAMNQEHTEEVKKTIIRDKIPSLFLW